ncbi:SpoIID/LytB domain-containing protein [Cellulosimicrobium arenosum]|uniref:SpoIID/LytB domain-containing protein n=1 Tax=Cellulosimicrobium arenosum TaxID=2708133 RepID=A0A927J1M2_9MICO|nr:SpoIID/LytB domain-containing protein [Cellulosimicrobium arenosum]MBD8080188.1 SpoIID/LytB domain-containing protein [Cellulosimicrobium arenosum]
MTRERTDRPIAQRGDRTRRRTGLRRLLAVVVSGLLAVGSSLIVTGPAQAAVPTSFTINGSGFGHGVGMPQYGAYELSRRGNPSWDILQRYYSGAKVAWKTTPLNVLVQVFGPDPYSSPSYGDTVDWTKVTVTGGDWRVRSSAGKTLASGQGTTTLRVGVMADGRAKIAVGDTKYYGHLLRIHWSGTRYYKPTGKPAVVTVTGAHGAYRHGRLNLTARAGVPNLTNELRLNTEYLYGIAEMPSSWGLAGGRSALAAQAITARSYALSKMTVNDRCLCHVVDDVRDQQFTGWKKENEGTGGKYGKAWMAGVDPTVSTETKARVLTYGGTPVAAHYYSSSGGRTANSEDVWSSRISYERSVSDPYSKAAPGNSYRSWSRKLTQAQARILFGLDDVKTIKVTATWSSGQARTLTATSSTGRSATVTGKADVVRSTVGKRTTARSMPAAWITSITAVA